MLSRPGRQLSVLWMVHEPRHHLTDDDIACWLAISVHIVRLNSFDMQAQLEMYPLLPRHNPAALESFMTTAEVSGAREEACSGIVVSLPVTGAAALGTNFTCLIQAPKCR